MDHSNSWLYAADETSPPQAAVSALEALDIVCELVTARAVSGSGWQEFRAVLLSPEVLDLLDTRLREGAASKKRKADTEAAAALAVPATTASLVITCLDGTTFPVVGEFPNVKAAKTHIIETRQLQDFGIELFVADVEEPLADNAKLSECGNAMFMLIAPLFTACYDQQALEALFKSTGGEECWDQSAGWMTDADIGDWYGVSVNAEGRVVELNLSENNLQGNLPPSPGLECLSALVKLDLSHNRIAGAIPPYIGNLRSLEQLFLHNNRLQSVIPTELGSLDRLTDLILSENELTGPVPSEIGELDSLVRLCAQGNQLTEIPPSLGELVHLIDLNLEGNECVGQIPPQLGGLVQCRHLHLGSNRLFGAIPDELAHLPALTHLFLGDNDLDTEGFREAVLGHNSNCHVVL